MLTHAILSHQQSTLFMTMTIMVFAGVLSKLAREKKFMKITIIGTGYVGLVTGLCFASVTQCSMFR